VLKVSQADIHKKVDIIKSMVKKYVSELKKLLPGIVVLGFLTAIFAIERADRHPYCGDASEYALQCVRLSYSLLHTPVSWLSDMVHVMPNKPPGLIWIGQFFVPLEACLGSIDKALLLCIGILISLSAILIYVHIKSAEGTSSWGALAGMLFLMSSPMLLTASFTFLVEPFQLFCVTIFLALMSLSIRLDGKTNIILLAGASALLLSSKINSAAYCVMPGIFILYQVIKSKGTTSKCKVQSQSSLTYLAMLLPLLALLALVTIWYSINLLTAYQHLKLSYSGDIAAIWGVKASFGDTLAYWVRVCCSELMFSTIAGLGFGYFTIALFGRVWKGPKTLEQLDVFLICSLVQIGIILMMCGMASNRSTRFLVPLIPYFSIIIGWSIKWVQLKILRLIFIMYLGCVLGLELLSMSNINYSGLKVQFPVRSVFNNNEEMELLNDIINKTKAEKGSKNNGSIIAIDPMLKGDWLAPAPLNYYAACHFKEDPITTYYCAGGGFFGSNGEDAIQIMKSEVINSVVIADPDHYPPAANYINQSLTQGEVKKIMNYLEGSGEFVQTDVLGKDKGLLLFQKYQKTQN
jgi:hypothetical protein